MKDLSMKELTTIALLGVLILISGSFKIPSPIAGGEFQLSAPIAVLICVVDMAAVCMGGHKKGVFALRPAHGCLISHTVCLLGGDLSGLE